MEEKDFTENELNMFETKVKQRFKDGKFMKGAKGHAYVINKKDSRCIENIYQLEIIPIKANELKKNQNRLENIKPRQIIVAGIEEFPYHYLFRHLYYCVSDIENKIDNTSYSPMQHTGKSSCIQHLILHTADIHTTFKPHVPFLSALVYHGFQRAKNMSDIFQIMSDIF